MTSNTSKDHDHWADMMSLAKSWQRMMLTFVAPSHNAQNGWFSPQITLNAAGDPATEWLLVNGVMSYGRQIGILTDALLALSKAVDTSTLNDDARQALKRIAEVHSVIEGVKNIRK